MRLRSRWLAMSPRARAMAICAAVAAVGLGLFAAFRGDSVERAVARGDIHAAKAELKQREVANAGARSYDSGRIAEAQKSYRAAAASYVTALRQGDQRGLDRLIDMTRDSSCPARTAAASALGGIRDERAVHALQDLRKAKFADERRGKKHKASACNSAMAARKALKRSKKAKA
jgi:HEAT repeat protein